MFKRLENMVKSVVGRSRRKRTIEGNDVINVQKVFGPYRNENFVAVKDNWSEVIATGNTPEETINNAVKAGYKINEFCITNPEQYFHTYILAAA